MEQLLLNDTLVTNKIFNFILNQYDKYKLLLTNKKILNKHSSNFLFNEFGIITTNLNYFYNYDYNASKNIVQKNDQYAPDYVAKMCFQKRNSSKCYTMYYYHTKSITYAQLLEGKLIKFFEILNNEHIETLESNEFYDKIKNILINKGLHDYSDIEEKIRISIKIEDIDKDKLKTIKDKKIYGLFHDLYHTLDNEYYISIVQKEFSYTDKNKIIYQIIDEEAITCQTFFNKMLHSPQIIDYGMSNPGCFIYDHIWETLTATCYQSCIIISPEFGKKIISNTYVGRYILYNYTKCKSVKNYLENNEDNFYRQIVGYIMINNNRKQKTHFNNDLPLNDYFNLKKILGDRNSSPFVFYPEEKKIKESLKYCINNKNKKNCLLL